MRGHLRHLAYTAKHKWHVCRACRRLGLSAWVGLVHDWTKFLPREWFAYVDQFYDKAGNRRNICDVTGAYDPDTQREAFRRSWLFHQRNKHHWQAWVSLGDGGRLSPLEIPERYCREMVADWLGAARAQGGNDPRGWYGKNRDKMVLHPESRRRIEALLEEHGGS